MGNSASKKKEEAELRAKDLAERKQRQEAIRLKAEAEEQAIRNDIYSKGILIVLQSSVRGFLARKQYHSYKAIVSRRKKIADEILSTEKSYVESLAILIETFNLPLLGTVLVNEHNQTRQFAHHKKDKSFKNIEDLSSSYSKSVHNSPSSSKVVESRSSAPNVNLNRRSMAVTSSETKALNSSSSTSNSSSDIKLNSSSSSSNAPLSSSTDGKVAVKSPSGEKEKKSKRTTSRDSPKRRETNAVPPSSSLLASSSSASSASSLTESGEEKEKKPRRHRSETETSRKRREKKDAETPSAFRKLRPVSSVLTLNDISEEDAPKIPGLTKDDVKKIFSQVEVIAAYNQNIGIEVEKRVNAWEWQQQLGDIFLNLLDFLKTYVAYVNNYNEALMTLDRLKTNLPGFADWLASAERSPQCNSLNLSGYLIMPIQRIPRYVMLLEDLLKHTPEDGMIHHRDHKDVNEALHRMKDVAKMINDKKREAENFQELVNLYNQLDPVKEDLCEAHRKLLRHGQLSEVGGEKVRLYLMNDIIIITKEKSATKQKMIYNLAIDANMVLTSNVEGDKKNKIFQIEITGSKGTLEPITLKAAKPEEKESWVRDIKEQIAEDAKRSSSFVYNKK